MRTSLGLMPKKPPELPQAQEAEPLEATTALGRPSSYRPEYTAQTIKLCALGATDIDIAYFFDVTPRTLNRWKVTRPEFAEALKRGKDPSDDRIENSLYHRAQDREVEEEQAIKVKKITYGENGKKLLEEERVEVIPVRKFLPGDTTAMIFWLKNRRAKDWRDVHKHEHGGAGAFDNWDDKQLEDYILTEAQEIAQEAPPQVPKPLKRNKAASTQH